MNWTSFKRIKAVFNHEIPDKVPKYEGSIEIKEINPIFDGQLDARALLFFSPQQLSVFHRLPLLVQLLEYLIKRPSLFYPIAKYTPKVISKLPREFNYDMFAYTSGIPMVFNKRIFNDFYTDKTRMIIKDLNGRLIWRTSPDGAHTRRGFMQKPEDWEKYMQFDPDHKGNYFLQKAALKTCKKIDIVPLLTVWGAVGFEELCSMFGFEIIFKFLIKNKSFIKSAVKEMNDYALATAEGILQRGGTYIYITADLGYKGRSLISPRMFKEFFKLGMKKFCSRVHQLGGKVMLHSCGNIVELMPDIVETGIDALHPIEKAAGNDILEFKNKYGKDIVFVGNVPIPLLTHGTPMENYKYVKWLIEHISIDGGHIISSSHSVTQWCKLKNFYAYYKAAEDFRDYPIKRS
ncbi:MAG: uroporphyrinogen decarboxylase family protein [Promethearchaeota archaeon]